MKRIASILIILFLLNCEDDVGNLTLQKIFVGNTEINLEGESTSDLSVDKSISILFSTAIDRSSANNSILLKANGETIEVNLSFVSDDKTIVIYPVGVLENNTTYTIQISDGLQGAKGEKIISTEVSFKTIIGDLELVSVFINEENITDKSRVADIPLDFDATFNFSDPVNEESFRKALTFQGVSAPSLTFVSSNNGKTFLVTSSSPLNYYYNYELGLSDELEGKEGEPYSGYSVTLFAELDETLKFPQISDEELLTLVQEQTFKYFWDFAHPTSGLTRERNTSGNTVTSGGSGFGMMAILVGIERGFISHQEGLQRLTTIVDFLASADRFHGAWSHWLDGNTGEARPFSTKDNGGDLVETSYVAMGLVTIRQYLNVQVNEEKTLIDKINNLLDAIEWDWYTQDENSLTWHWSPDYEFEMNMKIRGWNEALITYVMAASSKTHSISKQVYDEGWAGGPNMVNGKQFYNITLPLGPNYGGPLFFEQYTFTGLDPRNLTDQYANYWEQATNHTLINRAYCIDNPKNYIGYSEKCWGLTASDGNEGYSAHAPNNDRGVITPTAAISSIAFTPEKSMDAIKHFYYMLGDRLWGEYGFYDAFNVTENWYASSYLAIDQGPIILMIENYRTGLLWELFMLAPEVQDGLTKLGFTY